MTEAMHPWGSYELSRHLSLSMRDREIVIDRTARPGAAASTSGRPRGILRREGRPRRRPDRIADLRRCRRRLLERRTRPPAHSSRRCSPRDGRPTRRLVEQLASVFNDANLLDLLLLCGWYHAVSFVARVARVPLEAGAPTFEKVRAEPLE